MQHLDERAELYALGLTEDERAGAIEDHLAQCEPCRARVIAAEEAAASLSAALPPMPQAPRVAMFPDRRWVTALATAAALTFAVTSALEGNAARDAGGKLQQTDVALAAVASSHFAHTSLSADPGVAVKVIYARDGGWCYVLARNVPAGAHVIVHRNGAERDLGALTAGTPATLFARGAGRIDTVEIVADQRVIAHGTAVY